MGASGQRSSNQQFDLQGVSPLYFASVVCPTLKAFKISPRLIDTVCSDHRVFMTFLVILSAAACTPEVFLVSWLLVLIK